MNERIEKLAEQAGIWKPTHDHKTWVSGEYISSPGELEKFAELIINECVDVGREAFIIDHSVVPIFPDKQIKQHFGVDK